MKIHPLTFLLILFFLSSPRAEAQLIRMDMGVRAGELWVFPLATRPTEYRYLPDKAALSQTEDGRPAFSLLRYVAKKRGSEEVISSADGGALLTFLTEYGTSREKIEKAQETLREQYENPDIRVTGPVIFEDANYALISALVGGRDTSQTEVLDMNRVPVLEGSKMAYSYKLNPQDSKILLESFKMTTSDVSLTYELAFSGLAESFRAEIEVDWEMVYENIEKRESVNAMFHKSESLETVESLFTDKSVRLVTMGVDSTSQKLLDMAYEKVLNLVFEPIDIAEYREKDPRTIDDLERAWEGFQEGAMSMATFGVSSMGSNSGYRARNVQRTGKTRVVIEKSSKVTRHHYLTFNLGDLYNTYGEDERMFRTVNVLDPDFMQREVFVSLDGSLMEAFQQQVNDITVEVKKVHSGGETTLEALRIGPGSFEGVQRVAYLNRGDFGTDFPEHEMEEWMHYEYRTIWDFKGGGRYESEWERTRGNVNLFVPYRARNIIFMGDPDTMWSGGTQAVVIDLRHNFFGRRQQLRSLRLREGDDLDALVRDYVAPMEDFSYEYRLRFVNGNDTTHTIEWTKDDDGIIMVRK